MTAVSAIYWIVAVLRGLDGRHAGHVRWAAWVLVASFVVMMVSIQKAIGPHTSYLAAFAVLILGRCIHRAAYSNRQIATPAKDTTFSSTDVLLVVCGLLLTVLWIVQAGVEVFAKVVKEGGLPALLGAVAGAGFLAMATNQGIRTLVPVRGAFTARRVRQRQRRARCHLRRLHGRGPVLLDPPGLLAER